MLTAAMQLGQDRYTPSQWHQMAAGKSNLDRLQTAMMLKIQLYLRESQVVRQTSTNSREFQEACGALLRAEQRELSTGKASVQSFRD